MCNEIPCKLPKDAHPQWLIIRKYGKALRFRTRWTIIEYIGNGQKSSKEIYKYLIKKGKKLTKPGFYYHAPEKIWKIKTKRIVIDLLKTKEDAA